MAEGPKTSTFYPNRVEQYKRKNNIRNLIIFDLSKEPNIYSYLHTKVNEIKDKLMEKSHRYIIVILYYYMISDI